MLMVMELREQFSGFYFRKALLSMKWVFFLSFVVFVVVRLLDLTFCIFTKKSCLYYGKTLLSLFFFFRKISGRKSSSATWLSEFMPWREDRT